MSLDALAAEYVDAFFRFRPEHAVARGYEPHADRDPSFAPPAVAAFRAAVEHARRAVAATPRRPPDSEAALDREALRADLAGATFFIDELGWLDVNPLLYLQAGIDAFEGLELLDHLAPERRRALMVHRLRGLGPLLAEMEGRVHEPVAPFAEAALEMAAAAIDTMAAHAVSWRRDRTLAGAAAEAARALERTCHHLTRALRDARPFEPMGEARYRRLLADVHCLEHEPAALVALAERTLGEVEAVLPAIMRAEAALPSVEPPPGFGRDTVLAYVNDEVRALREAVRERGLLTIPEGRLEVLETPPYLQALLPGASYMPPPPFAPSSTGRFYVPPVPEEMDDDLRRYYADMIAHRRMRNLVAHEVYPGHHVQLLRAAEHPSIIRKVRDNDVLVEGWALYCEQLMVDEGLFEALPSARPWRALRLRALRVVVDVGLHTGRLGYQEAIELMCRRLGHGARGFVEAEIRRYVAEPTQAMSYLVGKQLVLELRAAWRDAVGSRHFDLRDFHDRLLAEGSVPLPLIAAKMLADARLLRPTVAMAPRTRRRASPRPAGN
ncbi:MAG: DUF885 domain-containing protein [Ectothiorhodospiraceae bacterium]|nr:DUF885 domain-containing protein [Ectothiorhodospiraceae bacterium]